MARLLVVESYPALATVVGIALERSGHDVHRVGSLQRALELEDHFDLTVLDIDLADGSGLNLAGLLLDEGRSDRVVFYTANDDAALREHAEQLGPLVTKEIGIEPLLIAVHDELKITDSAKVVGASDQPWLQRRSGRSGTRRRVPK
jgi:DNA-binding response OmpR family regulator